MEENRIIGRKKALEKFDNTISRISILKDKVNSNIEKFEIKGVDVTNAENLMILAETTLNEAKTKITEANNLLSLSVDKLSIENKTVLKTLTKEIQNLLKDTHKILNDAVKSLKDSIKAKIEVEKQTNQDTSKKIEEINQ